MFVVASEFTPGWSALSTLVGVLVGTLGAVVLTQRSERKRERERALAAAEERGADRAHERELRELELRDAHLARLHDARTAAYGELWLRMRERRRLGVKAQDAQGHWRFVKGTHPENAPEAEKAFAELLHGLEVAQSDAGALGQALLALDLVASRGVRAVVAELWTTIERELSLGLNVVHADDGRAAWDSYVAAGEDVAQIENELREAISDELGLHRSWGDDAPTRFNWDD